MGLNLGERSFKVREFSFKQFKVHLIWWQNHMWNRNFQNGIFWFGFGCWVATFWEIVAHSVDNNYVLFVLWLFVILVISCFGLEGWIWVLIASVPDLCILFTFNDTSSQNVVSILVGREIQIHINERYVASNNGGDQTSRMHKLFSAFAFRSSSWTISQVFALPVLLNTTNALLETSYIFVNTHVFIFFMSAPKCSREPHNIVKIT